MVVTDHHLAPATLPEAFALVNPNIPDAQFPGKNLAGVGVIFYTLLAVRSALVKLRDSFARAQLAQLLDLVAIGTVADVVPLDKSIVRLWSRACGEYGPVNRAQGLSPC